MESFDNTSQNEQLVSNEQFSTIEKAFIELFTRLGINETNEMIALRTQDLENLSSEQLLQNRTDYLESAEKIAESYRDDEYKRAQIGATIAHAYLKWLHGQIEAASVDLDDAINSAFYEPSIADEEKDLIGAIRDIIER